MICNCNNTTNGTLVRPKVKHVYGNVLRLAIPLTLRTIELVETEVDGETTQEAVATDTDFIPSSEYPVTVSFSKGAVKISLNAEMDGNMAYVEDKGKIPVGTYDITVTCRDDNGNPYRFNQSTVLQVVNATAEAGIVTPIEYEVTTWYLDAAIFMALKGEDGVGIDDIITESSGEIGGLNTVTILLTDGRTITFTIMNGSGSVDNEFNINSGQPIANSIVTSKFNQIDESLQQVFGDVVYDTATKYIQFYAKGAPRTKANILASLDARPFIKDGMVNSVYISNNTLVITFNTDAGREAIGVPLTSVFNPNNYYNKTQIDNRISQLYDEMMGKVTYIGRDNKLNGTYATQVVLHAMGEPYDEGDTTHPEIGCPFFENGYIKIMSNGYQVTTIGTPQSHLIYANVKTKKLYLWNGRRFVETAGSSGGGGSSSGYQVSYNDGDVIFTGSVQPTYDNGNIIF